MGARCPLLRIRIQNGPGPVPDAAEPLPGACGSGSRIEVNQAGAQEDPSHASLFQGSSTRKRREHGNGNATHETINPFSQRRSARTVSSSDGTRETGETLARPDSSPLWLFHGRARHDHRDYRHPKHPNPSCSGAGSTDEEEKQSKGEPPMTHDENKAVVSRFVEEFWSQGNMAAADELMTADATIFLPG